MTTDTERRLDLTDSEWMSVISSERDGLPRCCGNISELRDVLISIAREDGRINFFTLPRLRRVLGWCFPDHDIPSDVIRKICESVEFVPSFTEHEPAPFEIEK